MRMGRERERNGTTTKTSASHSAYPTKRASSGSTRQFPQSPGKQIPESSSLSSVSWGFYSRGSRLQQVVSPGLESQALSVCDISTDRFVLGLENVSDEVIDRDQNPSTLTQEHRHLERTNLGLWEVLAE